MILDQLHRAPLYYGMGERMKLALTYLQQTDFSELPLGRTELQGTDVIAIVQEYTSKTEEESFWEAHREYWDIQALVSGEERMGWAPLNTMQVKTAYDPQKDLEVFEGEGLWYTLKPGLFTVLTENDVHYPCVQVDGPVPVRKVVIKVRKESNEK
ncbi:YhcH/YjgK/YiaL family protein [Paenibacillus sp. y28]|uniref:YhcH/YjgK/YiaL family protein n=1 Tax=Paenibacillus sp. y28 TaxID=3129110 RepID=UPI00301A3CBC